MRRRGRSLADGESGLVREQLDHRLAVAIGGADARADRGRPERHGEQLGEGAREAVGGAAEGVCLALMRVGDAQRHRVLQARASQVERVAGLVRLRSQRSLEHLDVLEQLAAEDVRGKCERGRVHVVRRLRAVDVVVRVHAVVAAARAAEQLVRAIGDDLVRVHVDGRAAAAVDDVDRELFEVEPRRDLARRHHDRRRDLGGQLARREVRPGCGRLDVGEGCDELSPVGHGDAGDAEVRDRAHGVRAVEGAQRHLDRAERIALLPRLERVVHARIHTGTRVARSQRSARAA